MNFKCLQQGALFSRERKKESLFKENLEPLINTWEPAEDIYLRPPQPRHEMESASATQEQEGVGRTAGGFTEADDDASRATLTCGASFPDVANTGWT